MNIVRNKAFAIVAKIHNLIFLRKTDELESRVPLLWVGGFPAHYMGEFHSLLQINHPKIRFLYSSFGVNNSAFSHEVTNLPKNCSIIQGRWQYLRTWKYLNRTNPKSVLIAGNFPRINLVAAIWSIWKKRDLYYLSDANVLDYKNFKRSYLNKFFLSVLLRSVKKILAIGTRNKEFYLNYLDREYLSEILISCPLPHLNLPFESASLDKGGEVFNFLVFGRLERVKGVERIISAYDLLEPKLQKRSRLLIVGEGSIRSELEFEVRARGLHDGIRFYGPVPSNEAHLVFEKSNALIIASNDEPWGLVVNEALSAGVPVIGPFWIGAFVDLVINGKTGLVTRDNSPSELCAAMEKLIANPEFAITMGKNGRDFVRDNGWTIEKALMAFSCLPCLGGD